MAANVSTFPPHIRQLFDNLQEVESLLAIHSSIAGNGPGRKRDVEVLNKSAIVLVVACWEAFIEDLVQVALEFLIAEAKNHTVFPKSVLERVGAKNSGLNAWALAGDGWKKALRDNLSEVLAKTTGALNTPRAPQIDELFNKTVGLASLSASWKWKGRSQANVVKALDDLITLRGSIAHRVQHSRSVHKQNVKDALKLVSRLSAISTNKMRTHVHSLVGKYPWHRLIYGAVG